MLHFVLIEVCSVDILVVCLRITTGFEGIPSERCIYESTLVIDAPQKFKRIRRLSDSWNATSPLRKFVWRLRGLLSFLDLQAQKATDLLSMISEQLTEQRTLCVST